MPRRGPNPQFFFRTALGALAETPFAEVAGQQREIRIDAGKLFTTRQDLESVVVAVDHGHPVYLRDVADQIIDGPSEPANYVLFGTTNARAGTHSPAQQFPAVTVTLAKRKGTVRSA